MAKCGLIELVDSFAFTIDTLKYAAAEQRYREFLSGVAPSDDAAMREENLRLKKQLEDLQNQVRQLTDRVTRLESSVTGTPAPVQKTVNAKKPEDDDDVDLFGSDDEEDAESAKVREQRLAEYAAKKSKKPTLIAKSNVILDVKPWDDETDMKVLEAGVREITMDGLLWGASKLVPLAYGIKKLQISCVVEDDKVSIDELTEKIQENEDFVQSVDIAAFNKIQVDEYAAEMASQFHQLKYYIKIMAGSFRTVAIIPTIIYKLQNINI